MKIHGTHLDGNHVCIPEAEFDALLQASEIDYESGWLVESHEGHRWLRLVLTSDGDSRTASLNWTDDARIALRFARREDAAAFAVFHSGWSVLGRVTEHVFLPNAVVSGAPADAKE